MNRFDSELKRMAAKDKKDIPESVKNAVEDSLQLLPKENKSKIRPFKVVNKILAAAACIAFAFIIVMPNLSVAYAQKLEKVPVIGNLIKVVTVRNYIYRDEKHDVEIEVPKLDPSNGEAAQNINSSVQELTDRILEQFNSELGEYNNEGYASTYVDYEVLTNTPDWFTLKLTVHTVVASSDTNYVYYHIDRHTGKIIYLEDLFKSEDYAGRLQKIIKEQMKAQMAKDESKVYWTEKEEFGGEFTEIGPHHGFYFDKDGNLVIVFNKYEVGPGYMGCPEFKISRSDIKDILKPQYTK